MKTLKKSNKGFSLVELIVVILIMAIIAVALAPQVMKWVDESKNSADKNNIASIKSVVDAAIADYMATENQSAPTETFYIVNNKGLLNASAAECTSTFSTYVTKTMNAPVSQLPVPQKDGTGKCFKVEVTAGAVVVSIDDIPTSTP